MFQIQEYGKIFKCLIAMSKELHDPWLGSAISEYSHTVEKLGKPLLKTCTVNFLNTEISYT